MKFKKIKYKRGMSCSKKSELLLSPSNILSPTLPPFLLGL